MKISKAGFDGSDTELLSELVNVLLLVLMLLQGCLQLLKRCETGMWLVALGAVSGLESVLIK